MFNVQSNGDFNDLKLYNGVFNNFEIMMAFLTMAFFTMAFFTMSFFTMTFFTMAFSETHPLLKLRMVTALNDNSKHNFYDHQEDSNRIPSLLMVLMHFI